MDRLESMSMLIAVADAGSLSAAGRRLNIPLTTVSRKVSELEAHLGTQLIQRSSRRIALTDAGSAYIEACRRILDDIDEAERAASGEYQAPRGELVITAPIVFGRLHVLPVICEFLKAYPEIDIRLVQADRNINLADEHIHLAVRIGALPDSTMMATRVGEVRRVTCGSPGYFALRGIPQRPDDLMQHDCITSDILDAPDTWRFGSGRSETAIAIHPRMYLTTAEASIDAAIAGIGVARLLSYQVAPALGEGSLTLVLEDFEPPPRPVNLLHAGGKKVPLKLRAFLDFAAPRLRARLSGIG
ncbi:MAG TPA: LysR family transcriptional regulator [Alphaproteobacteria bacterium]|jgi:DNA-binding transcriptional LysR family regulator|nr:LysR family transcriptional regulator [Alphaproteobacteria bacterium]